MNRQEQRKLKHNPRVEINKMARKLIDFAMITKDNRINAVVTNYFRMMRMPNANVSAIRDDMKRYFQRVETEVATFERENGITTVEQLADVLVGE